MTTTNGTKFVTKDRLIYIMGAIIAFLLVFNVNQWVSAINKNRDDIATIQQVQKAMRSDLTYIKEGITELKKGQRDTP